MVPPGLVSVGCERVSVPILPPDSGIGRVQVDSGLLVAGSAHVRLGTRSRDGLGFARWVGLPAMGWASGDGSAGRGGGCCDGRGGRSAIEDSWRTRCNTPREAFGVAALAEGSREGPALHDPSREGPRRDGSVARSSPSGSGRGSGGRSPTVRGRNR